MLLNIQWSSGEYGTFQALVKYTYSQSLIKPFLLSGFTVDQPWHVWPQQGGWDGTRFARPGQI